MIFFKITFIAAALSGFVYGYSVGVFSGAILEIQEAFGASNSALGHLVALFEYVEVVGACLSFLADRYGRRNTLIVSCFIMCIAPMLPLVESSFTTLLITRGLSGLAAGYIFVVALVYVAEIAPKAKRPFMLSTLMVGVTAGYMGELGINAELATHHHWRLAIAFGALPALVQLIGLMTMKESPAFYRLHGRDEMAVHMANYYGIDPNELETTTGDPGIVVILRSLKNVAFRKQVWRGFLLVAAGTLEGHALLLSYGPVVIDYFGVKEHKSALLILDIFTFLGLLAGLTALSFIAKGHTRKLLLGSLLSMGIIQVLIGVAHGNFAILLLGGLQVSFTFGIRTTIFQLIPRLFTDSTRAVGVAFMNLVFLLVSATYSEIVLILFGKLERSLFFIHGVTAIVLAAACMRYIPKTSISKFSHIGDSHRNDPS